MSLKQKQCDIHWLTGQFKEIQQELSYRESIQLRVRRESRLALVLVSFIFAMFAITDYNLLGDSTEILHINLDAGYSGFNMRYFCADYWPGR